MLFVFYFLFLFTILLWLLLLLLCFTLFLHMCICRKYRTLQSEVYARANVLFLCVRVSESEIVFENNQENLSEGYFVVCIYFIHVDHACNSHIPIRTHVVQSLLLSQCTHRTLATVYTHAHLSVRRWNWRAQSYQTRVNGLRIVCIVYVYRSEYGVCMERRTPCCVPVLICISYVQ